MAQNQEMIIAELCAIIEQFTFADCNEADSLLYTRDDDSGYVTPVNQPAVDRFADLLSMPGLDISVSTSRNNSLIAHLLMVIDSMLGDNPLELSYAHTRHLLEILAAHPSTSAIVNHGRVFIEDSVPIPIVTSILVRCDCQELEEGAAMAAWRPIIELMEFNSGMPYDTAAYAMHVVDHVAALSIVNNPQFDASMVSVHGETMFAEAISSHHYDAVEAMVKMSNCAPNRLSLQVMRPNIAKHPVLIAASGPYQFGLSNDEITKKMMHALLAHKETDISRIRPHVNGHSEPNADSMLQMLAHKSFDIHNLVVEHVPGAVGDGDQVDMEVDEDAADEI